MVALLKLKIAVARKGKSPWRHYDVGKLKLDDKRREFQLMLQNCFELLAPSLGEERDVNEEWKDIKT